MAEDNATERVARVAEALGMAPEELTDVALDLFVAWLSGPRCYPTLSQQNTVLVPGHSGSSGPGQPDP